MKYDLINLYYDLKLTLPAIKYEDGAKIHAKLSRIEEVLWNKYKYDIALKHTFKLL